MITSFCLRCNRYTSVLSQYHTALINHARYHGAGNKVETNIYISFKFLTTDSWWSVYICDWCVPACLQTKSALNQVENSFKLTVSFIPGLSSDLNAANLALLQTDNSFWDEVTVKYKSHFLDKIRVLFAPRQRFSKGRKKECESISKCLPAETRAFMLRCHHGVRRSEQRPSGGLM